MAPGQVLAEDREDAGWSHACIPCGFLPARQGGAASAGVLLREARKDEGLVRILLMMAGLHNS